MDLNDSVVWNLLVQFYYFVSPSSGIANHEYYKNLFQVKPWIEPINITRAKFAVIASLDVFQT
jgi:hypothetical protein